MYTADNWVIAKITVNNETIYKLIVGYSGSYLYGSSWRINSGITSVEEDETHFYFHGSSGSVYKSYKDGYGITQAMLEPIQKLQNLVKEVDILPETTDFMRLIS